ncbi:MAG: hypothetical protein QW804_04140 [Candidatus Bathyarchaeia archaeon]|nr:hypothetical protein [Candidatus Bathyarchaeota archaeon]
MVDVTAISLEDREGVIKGPHYYLIKRRSLDELESEVYALLRERGRMPLSELWRRFDCHLWEIVAVLGRLKEKGLVEEIDLNQSSGY